jgi:hypothetical protein
MNATLPELRPPSVHRIPRAQLVDRITELRTLVRGRRVIDLGFVDEGQMRAKRGRGPWLHAVVAAEAREAIGVDADEQGFGRHPRRGAAGVMLSVVAPAYNEADVLPAFISRGRGARDDRRGVGARPRRRRVARRDLG